MRITDRFLVPLVVGLAGLASPSAAELDLEHVATFGDPRFRHADRITQIVALPDGRRLLSASEDRTVRLWDLSSGEQRQLFQHDEPVRVVVPLPDGQRILTGAGKRITLWDLNSGEALRTFGGNGEVAAIDLRPGGQEFAAGDGTIFALWDIETGQRVRTYPSAYRLRINSLRFSADGTRIYAAHQDSALSVWDADAGKEIRKESVEMAYRTAASPDREAFAMACTYYTLCVRKTDPQASLLWKHKVRYRSKDPFIIRSVAWSPDGSMVATALEHGHLLLFDAATGKQLRRIPVEDVDLWHYGAIAFSHDGKHLYSGGRLIHCHEVESGRLVFPPPEHEGIFAFLSLTSSGRSLHAIGHLAQMTSENNLEPPRVSRAWDLDKLSAIPGIDLANTGKRDRILMAPDGKLVLSWGSDGRVRAIEVASGELISEWDPGGQRRCRPERFLDDRRFLARGDGQLSVVDIDPPAERLRLETGAYLQLGLSPDRRYAATIHIGYSVKIWNLEDGKLVREIDAGKMPISKVWFTPDSDGVITIRLAKDVLYAPVLPPRPRAETAGEFGDFEQVGEFSGSPHSLVRAPDKRHFALVHGHHPAEIIVGELRDRRLVNLASIRSHNRPGIPVWGSDSQTICLRTGIGTIDVYRLVTSPETD